MAAEAVFWIGVIFASPSFFFLGRYLMRGLIHYIWPKAKVVITYYDEEEVKHQQVVHLNRDDQLLSELDAIKSATRKGVQGVVNG